MTKRNTDAQVPPAGTEEPKAADFPATDDGAAQFKAAHDAWQKSVDEANAKADAEAKAKADADAKAEADRIKAEQEARDAEEKRLLQEQGRTDEQIAAGAADAALALAESSVPGLITGDYLGRPITR